MIEKDTLQKYFFGLSLFLVSVLIFFVFLPFIEVIVLSAILAILLAPLHRKISLMLGKRSGFSAIIIIILFAIVIMIPTSFLITQVLQESKDLYFQLVNQSQLSSASKLVELVEGPIQKLYPAFTFDLKQYMGIGADFIFSHLSAVVSGVFNLVTGIILIFISLFFFLKDGPRFKKILIDLSPMKDEYDDKVFSKIKQTILATVKGVLFIAIVQGLLAGIGLKIFGIPNATLWGSVSAIASLVPGLGTAIVFIPAVAYLFIVGNTPSLYSISHYG